MKPGSTRLNVGLRNLSGKAITIHAKTAITQFTAANAIPETLAPHVTDAKENEKKTKKLPLLSTEKQDELFKKDDLTRTQELLFPAISAIVSLISTKSYIFINMLLFTLLHYHHCHDFSDL